MSDRIVVHPESKPAVGGHVPRDPLGPGASIPCPCIGVNLGVYESTRQYNGMNRRVIGQRGQPPGGRGGRWGAQAPVATVPSPRVVVLIRAPVIATEKNDLFRRRVIGDRRATSRWRNLRKLTGPMSRFPVPRPRVVENRDRGVATKPNDPPR